MLASSKYSNVPNTYNNEISTAKTKYRKIFLFFFFFSVARLPYGDYIVPKYDVQLANRAILAAPK